jgi:hypothetical protein
VEEAQGRLEVLRGGADASTAEPERPRRSLLGVAVWVLAALLVVTLVGLGLESRRASELEAELEGVAAELGRTQAALAAHRAHLAEVRSSVAQLQELIARDPEAAAPGAPAAADSPTP